MTTVPRAQLDTSIHSVVADRYVLLERISQGGMGEVFVARDNVSRRKIALKRLLSTHIAREALFRAEYHALARLKHPYIIQAYEYGRDRGLPFYTMELLDGQDLLEAGPSDYRTCCRMLRDVATSLALLHAQRLLHRDVSPRNVRKTLSGRCKLIDFGMMVPFGVPPNVAGTPPFVSPEAWDGSVLDQRSDLYSLGALGYWLITRKLPYDPKSIAQHGYAGINAPPRLQRTVPEVPHDLDELVMSLLELDPVKRPSSAAEVIVRLNQAAGLEPDDSVELAQSYLSSARFVGRRKELSALEQALSQTHEGQGASFFITGRAGIGRSRLLQEVALLAQTRGIRVVRAFGAGGHASGELLREIYHGLRRAAPDAVKRLDPHSRTLIEQLDRDHRAPGRTSTPTIETRANLHAALGAYAEAATVEGSWLLLIDDLHMADPVSNAFVASLARETQNRNLLVIATGVADSLTRSSAEAFASEAQLISLQDLDHDETRALCVSLFSNVPHLERLVDWLYRQAHGNPALTMELASLLMRKGVIRYVEGTFLLPPEEITEPVPEGLTHTLTLKLEQMTKAARETSELVATVRGSAPLELCLSTSSLSTEETLAALEELVQQGVLVSVRSAYLFAQEAMGNAIRQKLSTARSQELHARLAQGLLSRETQDVEQQLEAGWHLVHTDNALAGADLLANVTPSLIESGMAHVGAIEAGEKALAVYEQTRAPLEKRLGLRIALVRAGFLYDYKLAQRYGNDTIAMLEAWMALPTLRRLEPYIGGLLVTLLIFVLVPLKRLFARKQHRGPSAYLSLRFLARSIASLIGVRALALDGQGASELLEKISFFQSTPRSSSGRHIYLLCNTIAMQPLGREVAVREHAKRALDYFTKHHVPNVTEAERLDMRAGLLLSAGINECYRAGSEALSFADVLEKLGTPLARASAQRIRLTYHLVRGMRDEADRYRRMLDIHAIQGGTTWQVEWFAVPIEGLASARAGDLLAARRSLERLEELAPEVPSLSIMRDVMRVMYQYRRGNLDRAIELGAAFVVQVPMRSSVGWVSGYGAYAAALNDAGRHAEARDLCERARSVLSRKDFEYAVIYSYFDRELAIAYAGLGERAKADALLQANIDLYESRSEYALAYTELEASARVAHMHGDAPGVRRAVHAMREAARRSNSPFVLSQSARSAANFLRALPHDEQAPRNRQRGSALNTPLDGTERIEAYTPVRGFTRSRARNGLKVAMDTAGAHSAHLYVIGPENAMLAVSTDDSDPPSQIALEAWTLGAAETSELAGSRRARIRTVNTLDKTYELMRLPRHDEQSRISVLVLEFLSERATSDVPDSVLEKLTGWNSD